MREEERGKLRAGPSAIGISTLDSDEEQHTAGGAKLKPRSLCSLLSGFMLGALLTPLVAGVLYLCFKFVLQLLSGHAATQIPKLFSIPKGIQKVWIDVGAGPKSGFVADLKLDASLFLVAIEPTPKHANQLREALALEPAVKGRFVILERACVDVDEPEQLTFFIFPSEECNSLHKTNKYSPQMQCGVFEGFPPTETAVRSITLRDVLYQVPPELPLQLLKVDAQGHEWHCVRGAAEQLPRIDNIFIEMQDLVSRHKHMVYEGALNVARVDARLVKLDFHRQYCEYNYEAHQEMTCLYTRRGQRPLWVTRRPQLHKTPDGRTVYENIDEKPRFAGVRYVSHLETSPYLGELAYKLESYGLVRPP